MAASRIMIVDDHPLFRGALNQALSTLSSEIEIAEAGSLDELTEQLASDRGYDLVLLDLHMPGVQGLSGLMFLRAQYPETPVVIVSANDDSRTIRGAIAFGASGYIPKSVRGEDIRDAVRLVLAGGVWTPPDVDLAVEDAQTGELVARLSTLTPQQLRVLMMLGEGLLNKEIAYRLGVAEATIKAHVSAILQKLDVDNRTQAGLAITRIGGGDRPK